MATGTMHSTTRRGAISLLVAATSSGAIADAIAATSVPDLASRLKRVRAGVLDMAYTEVGPAAGPPVLLLHGFPYDIHCYDEVAGLLAAAGKRVIVPYLRGFGPTRFIAASTPRVGQQAALGNDVVALLDALGIRNAVLAGFDWGARSACVTAALHPERVSGLVVSGGPGYNIQNQAEFLKPRAPDWERLHWFYYYLNSQRGIEAFSADPIGFCRYLWQAFSPTWRFSKATFQQTAPSFANPDFVAVAVHSYRFRIGGVPGDPTLEPTERLLSARPTIQAPAIVLQGSDEGVDQPEPSSEFANYYPNLRRATVLSGVGHNAPQEAPKPFAEAVLEVGRPG